MALEEIKNLIREEQIRQRGNFIEGASLEEYLEKLEQNAEFLIHYSEGSCAGFVAFYCNNQISKIAFITLALISPEVRGKKIAISLIRGVLSLSKNRGFKTCCLEVKKNNDAAIGLYEKIGFSIMSENDNSYMMSKELE